MASVIAARDKRYLMLNALDDQLDDIVALLPGLDSPTVLPLARTGMHAVHAVVERGQVVELLEPLRRPAPGRSSSSRSRTWCRDREAGNPPRPGVDHPLPLAGGLGVDGPRRPADPAPRPEHAARPSRLVCRRGGAAGRGPGAPLPGQPLHGRCARRSRPTSDSRPTRSWPQPAPTRRSSCARCSHCPRATARTSASPTTRCSATPPGWPAASSCTSPRAPACTGSARPTTPPARPAARRTPEPRDGLVVIDQAYVEFGGEDLSPLVRERENTVVARTLSQGVCDRRRAGRLLDRAPGDRRQARRDPAARQHRVPLRRRRRDGAGRDRPRCASWSPRPSRSATGCLRCCAMPGMDVPESHTNFLSIDLGEPNDDSGAAAPAAGHRRPHFDEAPNAIRVTVATRPDNDRVLAALGIPPSEPAAHNVADGRVGSVERRTKETHITCTVAIDGSGRRRVTTGIGFLDHMLTALAFHSLFDLDLDLHRRPLGRRAPHGRGRRAGARPGDRPGARRPGRHRPLRRHPRAARRGAVPRDRRPRRPRVRAASTCRCAAAGSVGCRPA